jgi:hypothetical protein
MMSEQKDMADPAGSSIVLWCCHVIGPDDLYAAKSFEAAKAHADALNAALDRNTELHPELSDILCRAVPALWPWSPEAHAEGLAKLQEAEARRGTVAAGDAPTPRYEGQERRLTRRLSDPVRTLAEAFPEFYEALIAAYAWMGMPGGLPRRRTQDRRREGPLRPRPHGREEGVMALIIPPSRIALESALAGLAIVALAAWAVLS